MPERNMQPLGSTDNWEVRKRDYEYREALLGEAGETDFSDEARQRVEEANEYDSHLRELADRGRDDVYGAVDQAESGEYNDMIDRNIAANPEARRASLLAEEIAGLRSRSEGSVASEEVIRRREDALEGLLVNLSDVDGSMLGSASVLGAMSREERREVQRSYKEDIVDRIIEKTMPKEGDIEAKVDRTDGGSEEGPISEYGDSDVEVKAGGEYGLLNAERSTNRETIKDLGGGEEAPTSSSSFSVEHSEGVDSATGGTHGAPSEELEPPLASGAESGSSIEEDSASRSKGEPVSPTAEAAYMPTPEAPTAESPDGEGPEAADGHRLPRRMSGAGQRLTPESPSKPSPLVETEGDLDTPLALPPLETGGGTLGPTSMEKIIIPAPEAFPKSELPGRKDGKSEAAPEALNLPEGVDVRPQIGTEKIESAGGSWFDRMLPWRRRRKRDNPEAQLESTPKAPAEELPDDGYPEAVGDHRLPEETSGEVKGLAPEAPLEASSLIEVEDDPDMPPSDSGTLDLLSGTTQAPAPETPEAPPSDSSAETYLREDYLR